MSPGRPRHPSTRAQPPVLPVQGEEEAATPLVQRLFGIQTITRLKCEQTEETSSERNSVFALKCNIAIDTNLLDQGIRLGLKDDREKTSSVTNQMALFQVRVLTGPVVLRDHRC